MLRFFKKVFKVADREGDDEKNFRNEVGKLRRCFESKDLVNSDDLVKECAELFARLNAKRVEKNENLGGELADLDDVNDCQHMPNIDKTFKENCTIHLRIADKLESEILVKPGRQNDARDGHSGRTGHKMFGSGRSESRRQPAFRFRLKEYKVPRIIYRLYEAQREKNDEWDFIIALKLGDVLTAENYAQRFENLIYLEESNQTVELRRFDLKCAKLGAETRRGYFNLKVPGLAEGRPSLMAGDMLVLRSDKRPKGYEGYITEVQMNKIVFKLSEQIDKYKDILFDVYFKFNRTTYRRLHHGVSLIDTRPLIKKIIFPEREWITDKKLNKSLKAQSLIAKEQDFSNLVCFNGGLNDTQKRAVINILRGFCRPQPYIIYGPPGTGKTTVLVEAILQIHRRSPHSNILVAVNSNSAVEIIAERILKSGKIRPQELIRFSARSRDPLVKLKPITQYSDTLTDSMLKDSRIVLSTLIQSGALYNYDHNFDFLFVDEAGHATEPETLISVGLLKKEGLLVLAGDFHQLGPVCLSPIAKSHGLSTSLLQRLSERKLYQRRLNSKTKEYFYNEKYITKLNQTNRSDLKLLKVNNEMFYDNELTSNVKTSAKLLNYFGVKRPIIFEPIKGFEKQEEQSPSRCNPIEALACLRYVYRLQKGGMKPENIGIITPYKLQVEKLKYAFARCRLQSCKIGSVEEFQGDERQVIIISTVRTIVGKRGKNMSDKFDFLFQNTRFNVATSRAKYMNILIGDPDILKLDTCWRNYIAEAETVSF